MTNVKKIHVKVDVISVDRTANVGIIMELLYALVRRVSLEVLRIVALSVLFLQNAIMIKHVFAKNVLIHAQLEYAESIPTAG